MRGEHLPLVAQPMAVPARSVRWVPLSKLPGQCNVPRGVPPKLLSLAGMAISVALTVMAAGSLLEDPSNATTSTVAFVERHAQPTLLLIVPQ